MGTTTVDYRIENEVGYITFNPPSTGDECLLDLNVLGITEGVIESVETDKIRLLIVCSSSEKYFLVDAGLGGTEEGSKDGYSDIVDDWVFKGHRVFNKFAKLSIPIVAVTRGLTLGGGLELALACDFIVSNDKARFGMCGVGLGLVPNWGGLRRLPARIGYPKAMEMMFSGSMIDAGTALNIGLVNYVGSDSELDQYLENLTHNVRRSNRIAIANIKEILSSSILRGARENMLEESIVSKICMPPVGLE